VEHIIESLRGKHPEVTYRQLECVNDRPEFLQMAAEWADPQIEALLNESAIAVNPSLAATQARETHDDRHHHHHGDGHHHHHHH
jgi:ferrochelatase